MNNKIIVNVFDKTLTDENLKINLLNNKDLKPILSKYLDKIPKNIYSICVDINMDNYMVDYHIEIFYLKSRLTDNYTYVDSFSCDKNIISNIFREHTLNTLLNEH